MSDCTGKLDCPKHSHICPGEVPLCVVFSHDYNLPSADSDYLRMRHLPDVEGIAWLNDEEFGELDIVAEIEKMFESCREMHRRYWMSVIRHDE